MEMKETVSRIAVLAKLEYKDAELEKFSDRFTKILDYIAVIDGIDLEGVEPLAHVIETENVFRADVAKPGVSLEQALRNAPKKNESFFKVPKVIEQD